MPRRQRSPGSGDRTAHLTACPRRYLAAAALLLSLLASGAAQARDVRSGRLAIGDGLSAATVRDAVQDGAAPWAPSWHRGWLRFLALLAVAAGALAACELRVRNARRDAERLESLVRERTRELEEVREQLQRRERLAALGELAGSVAHEIRNPLGVIKNSAYYLRLTRKLEDPKGKEHLSLIESEVERSNHVITELLDYARNPPVEAWRFPLQDIVAKAIAGLEVPAAVAVETHLATAPLTVEADPGQIERILSNLLANAVQAMPEGGTLHLGCHRRGEEAIAEVVDSGVGIEEESLSKIFEPLFTSKTYGIGLGLALSQRYAELNRGRIECETRLGQGTTFRLVLPRVED